MYDSMVKKFNRDLRDQIDKLSVSNDEDIRLMALAMMKNFAFLSMRGSEDNPLSDDWLDHGDCVQRTLDTHQKLISDRPEPKIIASRYTKKCFKG